MFKIISILFLVISLSAQEDYQLGKGVQVDSLPLYVGGYFSVDYRNMGNENRYRVDDLAVLGYGSYKNFSYMAEFEYKEFYVQTYKGDTKTVQKDRRLHTERLYLDYNLNENYMFRAGKYNTPIGFWNLLPVNVLRDTTSNPVSTSIIFPKFITGAGASYSSYDEGEFKVDLMLQNGEDLDDEYNNYKVDEHYGLNLSYEKDEYSIKVNGGYFHKIETSNTPDRLYYFLLSGRYDLDKIQLQSEIGTQRSSSESTTDYAGYIQGLYRFSEGHAGIVRFESYDDKVNNISDDIAIVGYTYRPVYPIAIKSEYQFHSISAQNQFLFSFSVMF